MGAPHQPGGQQPLFGVVLGQPAQITLASRQLGFRPAFQIVGQAFALGVDQPAQPVPAAPAGGVTERPVWRGVGQFAHQRRRPGGHRSHGAGVNQGRGQGFTVFRTRQRYLSCGAFLVAVSTLWRPPLAAAKPKQSESASRQRMRRRLVCGFAQPTAQDGLGKTFRRLASRKTTIFSAAQPESLTKPSAARRPGALAQTNLQAVRQGAQQCQGFCDRRGSRRRPRLIVSQHAGGGVGAVGQRQTMAAGIRHQINQMVGGFPHRGGAHRHVVFAASGKKCRPGKQPRRWATAAFTATSAVRASRVSVAIMVRFPPCRFQNWQPNAPARP